MGLNITWFNEDTEKFMRNNNSYLRDDETIEERLTQIADRAFVEIYPNEEYRNLFLEYVSKGYISLSTPVYSNFGRKGQLSISCFGSYIEDTMESILGTVGEVGMMSKHGGGTSAYLGNLRPRGSKISKGGTSEGSVHFAKLFESVIQTCHQSGSRRGSMSVTLPVTHPDIEEFLTMRHESSVIQHLFPSISIDNQWMRDLKAGDTEKRKIWTKILQSRQMVGTPFIFFKDHVNDNKPQIYKDADMEIVASNLCVVPNTQILTSNGYQLIGDLENEFVDVWNGSEWSNVQILKTGTNQELVRVTTDSGYELDCTPYHKFYIQKGYSQGTGVDKLETVEVRAKDLKQGDTLIKFDLPIIEGSLELDNAYINGFYSGVGCLTPQGQRIYLCGEKRKLISNFNIIDKWVNQPNNEILYGHTNVLKDKFFVPDCSYTIESRLNWLAGYLDANGTVVYNNGRQSLQIVSIEKEFLKEIQLMLQTLGVDSKITLVNTDVDYYLAKNDGSGDLELYSCKEINGLLINGHSLYKLSKHRNSLCKSSQVWIKCNRLNREIEKLDGEYSQFIKIKSVETLTEKSDTYCFTEPKRHLGMFNGILTGQCQEIMLPSSKDESFICCLASLNAELFDEWKLTKVVAVLTAFLDTVISDFIETAKGIKYLERAVKFAERHRSIGIGVLGFHSYLQRNKISFESFEAKRFNTLLFSNIRDKAMDESIRLGIKLGYAPIFTQVEHKDRNRRNVCLMAVAPTSSSSFILGQVSQGIEPFRSNFYTRNMGKNKIPQKNKYLVELLKEKGKDTEEVWESIAVNFGSVQHLDFLTDHEKDVFKTFDEISQIEIIALASARQRYIDQGQSLNLMFNPKTPAKDLNTVMLNAWGAGIKTLYYHHTSSELQKYSNSINCRSCEA